MATNKLVMFSSAAAIVMVAFSLSLLAGASAVYSEQASVSRDAGIR